MFLGNWIDSVSMTIFLPIEKVQNIISECNLLFNSYQSSIRKVAKVVGLMVSSFSAVEYGPLFYRRLERERIQALKRNQGNFDAQMLITNDMKKDLLWWIETLPSQKRHISHGNPDICITSDASLQGWGAPCDGCSIGGRWKSSALQFHINYLELLAIFLALKSFCMSKSNISVQIKTICVPCLTSIPWVALILLSATICQKQSGIGVLKEISGFLLHMSLEFWMWQIFYPETVMIILNGC